MSRNQLSVFFLIAFISGLQWSAVANAQELDATPSVFTQDLLPASTKAWFSIPDAKRLDEKFLETQLGKLSRDEALEPFIESLKKQFKEWLTDGNTKIVVPTSIMYGLWDL